MTFFDAVLDKDMNVLFNGTREETKHWMTLEGYAQTQADRVVLGENLQQLSPAEFIERFVK